MFTVEHNPSSHSFLTYKDEFRGDLPDSAQPKTWTISRLINRFHDTRRTKDRKPAGRHSVLSKDNAHSTRLTLLRFPRNSPKQFYLQIILRLFSDFNVLFNKELTFQKALV